MLTNFLENRMIRFAKNVMDKEAQRLNDARTTDALIELDDSVLDQIGGSANPVARSRPWFV